MTVLVKALRLRPAVELRLKVLHDDAQPMITFLLSTYLSVWHVFYTGVWTLFCTIKHLVIHCSSFFLCHV
jgi:hypothetical protein